MTDARKVLVRIEATVTSHNLKTYYFTLINVKYRLSLGNHESILV